MTKSWYFPGEDILKKAGALGGKEAVRDVQNIKINEQYGIGILAAGKAIGQAQSLELAENYASTTSSHSQTFYLSSGLQDFVVTKDLKDIIRDSVIVYKNGGEALEEGKDYDLHPLFAGQTQLQLRRPAKSTDDDLEFRCKIQIPDPNVVQHVLLLPRKLGITEFVDEELQELLPTTEDIFSVDRLMKYGNSHLLEHLGKKATIIDAKITDLGIEGTIRVIK